MKCRSSIPLALLALLALGGPVGAEVAGPANITGVWQLDLERTRMWKKATRPLWRTDEIRHEGDDVYWTWHAEEPKGPWKDRVHLTTDGRVTHNVIAGHKSKSRGAWQSDTLTFVTRGRAYLLPYRLDDRIWLSENGQVMNVLRQFRMATLNEDEHWVFRRADASAAERRRAADPAPSALR